MSTNAVAGAKRLPDLSGFYGSDQWYRHLTQYLYTQGVKHLAEHCGAYWLIDQILIANRCAGTDKKFKALRNNPRLREIQFWTFVVQDGKGTLTCVEDTGHPPAVTIDIEFTDFPETGPEGVQLWFENGVLMLPSER